MSQGERRRSKSVNLAIVPLLAAAFAAGCGDDDDDETAYCVNEENEIVENRYCDSGTDSSFFWFYGGSGVGGRAVRGARLTGGERIVSTNRAANAARGGFGGSSRSGGVGRATSSSGFGSSSGS